MIADISENALNLSAHRCYSLVRGKLAGWPLREPLQLVWRLACDYSLSLNLFTSLRPPLLYVSKWGAGWLPAGERSERQHKKGGDLLASDAEGKRSPKISTARCRRRYVVGRRRDVVSEVTMTRVGQPSGRVMMDGMLAAGGPTSGLVERSRSPGRPGPLATSNNSVELCERRAMDTCS